VPIRPENRDRYPADWPSISARIRERAGGKCEKCGAPNGESICRGEGHDAGTYMVANGDVFDDETGKHLGRARGSEYVGRYVVVVLTVAHLDHTPENCADENLKAWCQRCHNAYDAPMRAAGRRERRRALFAVADLFG
jgi:5-methylcytosine-specific restriction endonuclease McrA